MRIDRLFEAGGAGWVAEAGRDGWGWMGVSTPAIVRLPGGFVGNATGDFVADFYERR